MFEIEGLDHIAITVTDMERSRKWYQDVLGMADQFPGQWGGVPTMMFAGGSGLALFPARQDARKSEIGRGTIAVQHIAFRVTRANFEAAQERLRELGIPFEFQDHEISRSIYFDDPDGYQLEMTTYEL